VPTRCRPQDWRNGRIPPGLSDEEVVRHTGVWFGPTDDRRNFTTSGFIVSVPIADPEDRRNPLLQKLRSMPDLRWGMQQVEGRWVVRYLLRHHEGLGFMHDTVALDFKSEGIFQWYVETLTAWIKLGGVDGFRLDLADRVDDEFWADVKSHLAPIAVSMGKALTFVHEDFRDLNTKAAAHSATARRLREEHKQRTNGMAQEGDIVIGPDLYYNNALFELFKRPCSIGRILAG